MVDKKFNFQNKIRTLKLPTTGQFILMGVGLVIAVVLYIFLSGFVSCWRLTALPGIPPSNCAGQTTGPVITPEGTPVAGATGMPTTSAPQVELPPPWDGASRVTILVIGLDYRDWITEQTASRSDTMILLTIDPVTKTAGMLSIPRDMWVNIPGFSYNKINTAFYLGELYHLPGGGPGMAMKTAENFLGNPNSILCSSEF